METRFVAEVGSNHNGDIRRALALIREAKAAGFDAVKFQMFEVRRLFHSSALDARPELLGREKMELPSWWLPELSAQAFDAGIRLGLSAFDVSAVAVAHDFIDFWKISSYDLMRTDIPRAISRQAKKPVVASTGMSSMSNCLEARYRLHALGLVDLTFLHCLSAYPAEPDACNLAAIDAMQKELGHPVGWSDHTASVEVIERAVWRWRSAMVEMHVDLDDGEGMESGAHCWSMRRAAFVIERTRGTVPDMLARSSPIDGDGKKRPQLCEQAEAEWCADDSDGLRPLRMTREKLHAHP